MNQTSMDSHLSEAAGRAHTGPGMRRRSIPLEVRQDDAARQREAVLTGKAMSAHAHNAHVLVVAARARAERERAAEQAQIAARQRLDAAEKRRRARIQYCEKRLRAMNAQREQVRLLQRALVMGKRTCDRRGCNGILRDLQSAERRRGDFLKSRARRAAGLAAAAQSRKLTPTVVSSSANSLERSRNSRTLRFCPRSDDEHKRKVPSSVYTAPTYIPTSTIELQAHPAPSARSLSDHAELQRANNDGSCRQREACANISGMRRMRTKREFAAARRIAGYWSLCQARKIFCEVGLLGSSCTSREFESTAATIQNQLADKAARLTLRAIGTNPRAARVLLSSILFAFHHDHVMESCEDDEHGALFAARRLVLCLYCGTLPALAYSWRDWRIAYGNWREADKKRIGSAIIADVVATEALRMAVHTKVTTCSSSYEDEKGVAAVWNEQIDAKQAQLQSAMISLFGDEGARRFENSVARARTVPDEYLAHEIMLDLDAFLAKFKARAVPEGSWQLLLSELQSAPPRTDELFRRMDEIAVDLNAMKTNSFPPVDRSRFSLDVACATQFLIDVAAALRQSQAPSDDMNLQEWLEDAVCRLTNPLNFVSVVVSVLQELKARVASVRERVAIARILHLAPVVQQHGIAWERSVFNERLLNGEIMSGLPRTQELLQDAIVDEQGVRSEYQPDSARKLLRSAMIKLCCATDAVNTDTVPEILSLDLSRILSFQNEIQRIALCAMLENAAKQFLTTSYNCIARSHTFYSHDTIAEALWKESVSLEVIQDCLIHSVGDVVQKHLGKDITMAEKDLLRGIVFRAVKPGDVVFSLMLSRVALQLQILLNGKRKSEGRGRLEDISDREGESVPGLGSVQSAIATLASRMERLAAHTYDVHGEHIVRLASDLQIGADLGRLT